MGPGSQKPTNTSIIKQYLLGVNLGGRHVAFDLWGCGDSLHCWSFFVCGIERRYHVCPALYCCTSGWKQIFGLQSQDIVLCSSQLVCDLFCISQQKQIFSVWSQDTALCSSWLVHNTVVLIRIASNPGEDLQNCHKFTPKVAIHMCNGTVPN